MTGKCGGSEEEITQQQAVGTGDYTLCNRLRDLSQRLSSVYIFSLRFLFLFPLSSVHHFLSSNPHYWKSAPSALFPSDGTTSPLLPGFFSD